MNVLWRIRDIAFPPQSKNVVRSLHDIVQGLIAVGSSFKNQFNNPNIFIRGLLPQGECFPITRFIIDEINNPISFKCAANNFYFIDQVMGGHNTLDFSLFYLDGLHLVEEGNLKVGKSILKAIDSTITS